MKAKSINMAEVKVELEDEEEIVIVDEVGITTTIPIAMKDEKILQEVVEEEILI